MRDTPAGSWQRPAAVAAGSQPLRDIYLLTVADVPEVTVTRQSGAALFDTLQDCIYGPLLPTDIPRVFGLQALVCQSVRVWRIRRPRCGWSLEEVAEVILCG